MEQTLQKEQQQAVELIQQELPCQLSGVLFFADIKSQKKQPNSLHIALLFRSPLEDERLTQLAQQIATTTNMAVELIDLLELSTASQMQWIEKACWVYQPEPVACAEIEVRIISMYHQLQTDRRKILFSMENG